MTDLYTHTLPYISKPDEIPNDEYHNGEKYSNFISSTKLKYYLTSPKWYKYLQDNPSESKISLKAAMEGSVYHDMLASMVNNGNLDGFNRDWFVFDAPINQRTSKPYGIASGAYMEAYEEAKSNNPGKETTSHAEIAMAKEMINQLLYNNHHYSSTIRKFIGWGKAEQSCFCEYEGHRFKYRTDLKTKTKIIDWKTTQETELHESNIAKLIVKFKYDISAAFYQFFEYQITGVWKPFYWVFQQKSKPYDAVLVSADQWAYEVTKETDDKGNPIVLPKHGALKFQQLLAQHISCKENDSYPGASVFIEPDWKGHRVMFPDVPSWKKNEEMNFYNDK